MMAEDDIYHFFLDENRSAGPELVVAFSRPTWWHGCSDSSAGHAIATAELGLGGLSDFHSPLPSTHGYEISHKGNQGTEREGDHTITTQKWR